jgi:hypothetical protein
MSDPQTPPSQPPLPAKGAPPIHRHGISGLPARSKDQQQRFAHDIERKVLGPMPVKTFLNEFFPDPDSLDLGDLDNEINFASVPDSPSNEREMYKGLVSVKVLWIRCLANCKLF